MKIYVVDDHPVVRKGLVDFLKLQGIFEICGESESAEQALLEIPTLEPDLVILDLSLKEMGGLELLSLLRAENTELKVLILSMHQEDRYAARAIRLGACGYITKDEAIEKILEAIKAIQKGKIYLRENMINSVIQTLFHTRNEPGEEDVQSLSDRELQVFECLGKGMGTKAIADKLGLSIKTVETYRARIKDKLSLKDGSQLLRRAILWAEQH